MKINMILQKDDENAIDWSCKQEGSFKENGISLFILRIRNTQWKFHNEKRRIGKFDTPLTGNFEGKWDGGETVSPPPHLMYLCALMAKQGVGGKVKS